jgi:hypothetical protein
MHAIMAVLSLHNYVRRSDPATFNRELRQLDEEVERGAVRVDDRGQEVSDGDGNVPEDDGAGAEAWRDKIAERMYAQYQTYLRNNRQ